MEKKEIMQMRPYFGHEEAEAINNYMKTDGFLTEFKLTEEFAGMLDHGVHPGNVALPLLSLTKSRRGEFFHSRGEQTTRWIRSQPGRANSNTPPSVRATCQKFPDGRSVLQIFHRPSLARRQILRLRRTTFRCFHRV